MTDSTTSDTDGGGWQPLMPQVAHEATAAQSLDQTVDGIKALISGVYPEITFLIDTHKAGYRVINCQGVVARFDATLLTEAIEENFHINCRVAFNAGRGNSSKSSVFEVLVPHKIKYQLSERFSFPQYVTAFLGILLIAAAIYLVVWSFL